MTGGVTDGRPPAGADADDGPWRTLADLGTATLGEVAPAVRILDPGLRPIRPGQAFAGPAATVRCPPGDNLALHRAIARLSRDAVLVVDYGGSLQTGPFGEILAVACQTRGGGGLVIDGAVRDTAAIVALGFPVMARGRAIPGTVKRDRGELDEPVTVGGVPIRPGDLIVADDDAVIALPADGIDAVIDRAQTRQAAERDALNQIRQGRTTLEVFGLTD